MNKLSVSNTNIKLFGRGVPVLIVASVIGGTVGVSLACLMMWLSHRSYAVDSADKHGISVKQASRLGGVAIAFGILAYLIMARQLGLQTPDASQGALQWFRGYEGLALGIAMVGLAEDILQKISPLWRLGVPMAATGAWLWFAPQILPSNMEFWGFADLLNHPLVMGLAVTVLVVGFVNAGNIADGANGLLSSIALCALWIVYLEFSTLILFAALMSCAVFFLYNILTGSIFLGDFGSYGLSAFVALSLLDLFVNGDASMWFCAALVSYPCIEMIRSMYYRHSHKIAMMSADNSHLHNKLYQTFKNSGYSSLVSNSITGLILGAFPSGLVAVFFVLGLIPSQSSLWFFVFLGLVVIYLLGDQLLGQRLRQFEDGQAGSPKPSTSV